VTPQAEIERIAAAALAEDGESDITTAVSITSDIGARGTIEYRDGGILAGTAFADAVASRAGCSIAWTYKEGTKVTAGAAIGVLQGALAAILRTERPMLNLLQRACGIANATGAYVEAVRGTQCHILHTRKTAPGLRALDVTGVLAGGGQRHRVDLAHEVMVKDNHWQALGAAGLGPALARARRHGIRQLYVEVENVDQLELATQAGATRLLIDNQTPDLVRAWAGRARSRSPGIEIEATGGITLNNVRHYAEAGADFVSIGALTHSVRAADLAMEVVQP
jgi:nicotinate-nucleotide pyrophosphorylase (carboxylating)